MMATKKKFDFIAIVGPTASGKSELAMQLASCLAAEIINCDSVQIYKGFDIGSTKPSRTAQQKVVHHLIDSVGWHEEYNAGRYSKEAREAITAVIAKKKLPLVVGGCGLYFRALIGSKWHNIPPSNENLRLQLEELSNIELQQRLQRIDPARAEQIHLKDRLRLLRANEIATLTGKSLQEIPPDNGLELRPYVIYLKPQREKLCANIEKRSQWIIENGLVEEVKNLLAAGCPEQIKPLRSIGYRQAFDFIQGKVSALDLLEKINCATRQYAKRQVTWFNKTNYDMCITDLDRKTVRHLQEGLTH